MAQLRQTDEHAHETADRPAPAPHLKRRGLIAGAAALAAAVLAKQASTPVSASYSIQGDSANTATAITTLTGNIATNPIFRAINTNGSGGVTPTIDPVSDGLQGYTTGANNAGVFGRNNDLNGIGIRGNAPSGQAVVGESSSGIGVSGTSNSYNGVYGQSSSGTGTGGVSSSGAGVGGVSTSGYGVNGSSQSSAGVYGQSATNSGVVGLSTGSGQGVIGQSFNQWGMLGIIFGSPANTIGVYGANRSSAGGIGVQGDTPSGTGVFGNVGGGGSGQGVLGVNYGSGHAIVGNSTNGAGVYGSSVSNYGVYGIAGNGAGAAGVYGVSSNANAVAIGGTAVSPSPWAGLFSGNVWVTGAFYVSGTKSAAVKHPDGSYRSLYCVESPESWFEDIGESKLVSGKVDVKFDATFVATIHSDAYHVFLTPYSDSKGLFVTNRTATGFSVQEQQGGTSATAFSYRIVAKRKDVSADRFAVVTPPPAAAAIMKAPSVPTTLPDAKLIPVTIPPNWESTLGAGPATAPDTTSAPNTIKTATPTPTATSSTRATGTTGGGTATGTAATPNAAPPARP